MFFLFIFQLLLLKYKRENDLGKLEELFTRSKIQHPAATINKEDLQRAKINIEKYKWAQTIKRRILNNADQTITFFSEDSVLDNMIPRTTPASLTFCPHCASLGDDYHPNGDWSWSSTNPDQIKCSKCGTIFPNSAYPETIKITSEWDPEQTITYIDNGPKKCMNFQYCYSSINGLIRKYKLEYTIKRLTYLAQAYSLSNDVKYAEATKRILLKLSERFPKYLVYCGYSYNQYADCDPHYVVQDLPNLPVIDGNQCPMIAAGPKGDTFFSDYWSASRLGSSGEDGELVEIIALAYDLVADAVRDDETPVFSETEKKQIEEDLLIESALLGFFDKSINNKSTMNMKGCTIVGLIVGNAKLVHFGLDGYNRVFDDFFLKDGSTSQSVTYGLKTLLGFDGFHLAFRNYTDPDYYTPSDGQKSYKNFNINKDTEYESLWQALMWCSYYDTSYPIIGDQSFGDFFPKDYYEFLTNEYKHDYIQEYIGSLQNMQELPHNNGIFLRDPDYVPYDGVFSLPDMIYPYQQQGFIRSGENGEESLLILDASPSDGGHHHYDSLNVIYTKYNNELLLDLGYLLDHPNKSKTMATSAHNTVVIDGSDQINIQRGGEFHIFDTTLKDTKVMQASSHPYKDTDVYHRTLVQIEHEKGKNYVVDIFRSNGGSKRRELALHGPNNNYTLNKPLSFSTPYDVTYFNGYVQFAIRQQESFEIADISMYETLEDGSKGEELVQEIPDQLETPIKGICTDKSFFCYLNRNTNFEYSIVDGPEPGKKAIKFECKGDTCSSGLNIGHESNLLSLKDNSRYILQFKIRGQSFVKNTRLIIDGNQTELKKLSAWDIDPNKWNLFVGYFDIGAPFSEALGTTTNDQFSVHWKINEEMNFSVFVPARTNQKIFFKNGWGQRYTDNRDFGATLPYFFFNRDLNEKVSTYVTVYEGFNQSEAIVKGVEAIDDNDGNVIIKINTNDGFDYVSSSFNEGKIVDGFGLKSDAKIAVINNGKPRLFDGSFLEFNNKKIERDPKLFTGNEIENGTLDDKSQSWFDINAKIDLNSIRPGQILFVKDEDGFSHGYPIQSTSNLLRSGLRIYVKDKFKGFKSHTARSWHLIDLASEYDDNENNIDSSSQQHNSDSSFASFDETNSNTEIFDSVFKSDSDNTNADVDNEPNQNSNGKGLSKGAIAGIVVSVMVVVAVAIAVGLIFYFKNKREMSSNMEI